jgi:hypothetical protein
MQVNTISKPLNRLEDPMKNMAGVFGRTNLLREHALPLANHVDCVIDLS